MRLLVPVLLIAVLAPAACVFCFMNQAARSQAEAAERGVTEAYRGQLRSGAYGPTPKVQQTAPFSRGSV
jgi:hypothetical protein